MNEADPLADAACPDSRVNDICGLRRDRRSSLKITVRQHMFVWYMMWGRLKEEAQREDKNIYISDFHFVSLIPSLSYKMVLAARCLQYKDFNCEIGQVDWQGTSAVRRLYLLRTSSEILTSDTYLLMGKSKFLEVLSRTDIRGLKFIVASLLMSGGGVFSVTGADLVHSLTDLRAHSQAKLPRRTRPLIGGDHA